MTIKWTTLFALTATAPLFAGTVLIDAPFQKADELKAWGTYKEAQVKIDGGAEISLSKRASNPGTLGLNCGLPLAAIAGRRLKVTGEGRGENIEPPKEEWNGAKIQLNFTGGETEVWPQHAFATGSFDWTPFEFYANTPFVPRTARVNLGFEDSFGKVTFRNLKIEVADTYLNLASIANMGYKDEVEADDQGGWSDQGPENDAAKFKFKTRMFSNVPFVPADPDFNRGKAVVSFRSGNLPKGAESVTLDLRSAQVSANYLYLLHTLSFAKPDETAAGTITVTGTNGKQQKINLTPGTDIADWWEAKHLPNGHVGATWNTAGGTRVGLYTSKFKLDSDLGQLEKIAFTTVGGKAVWILVAGTLSDENYRFPR